jgi:hypothetical protein
MSLDILKNGYVRKEGYQGLYFAINNIDRTKKKEVLEEVINTGLEFLNSPA